MKIKNDFEKKMSKIPDFIKTTDFKHKQLWVILYNINDIYSRLIKDRVLNTKEILYLVEEFIIQSDKIYEIDLKGDINLFILFYQQDMLEWIKNESFLYEEYETLENIKNFENLLDNFI
jgi:hypothetical protein